MTTNLDALEARAKTRQAIDPPTALALIAELRRARECIEKVRAVPNEFEWDVPPTAKQILATYDQEGAS